MASIAHKNACQCEDVVGTGVGASFADAPRYYPRKVTNNSSDVTNDFFDFGLCPVDGQEANRSLQKSQSFVTDVELFVTEVWEGGGQAQLRNSDCSSRALLSPGARRGDVASVACRDPLRAPLLTSAQSAKGIRFRLVTDQVHAG